MWFDLDNSPHVPLFRPILSELSDRQQDYIVTSRDHAQTEALLKLWMIPHVVIGRHGGKEKIMKIFNLLHRSLQLMKFSKGLSIKLAISHGSRTHLVASRLLGIPYIWMQDYEYQEKSIANRLATYILLPSYIPDQRVLESGYDLRKVVRYRGFKEEIYLGDFRPYKKFRKSIGVEERTILAVLRPPSVTANYHGQRSERLFIRCLEYLSSNKNVYCLVVNRTKAELPLLFKRALNKNNIGLLKNAVDGLQLLWNADLFIGGGGTMNREAALLGVPTYSIFTGRHPFLDEYLVTQGKLRFISRLEDVETIPVNKRCIGISYQPSNLSIVSELADIILDIASKAT